MNIFKVSLIAAAIVVAGVIGFGNTEAVEASSKLCTLEPLQWNEYKKSFTINGDSVTAKFTLKGDADCKFDMTLFTFEAKTTDTSDPDFFKTQKLYSYQTGSFGPGTHTLTTSMPQCYHQLDLVTGKPISAQKGETLFNVVNATNMTNQGHIGTDNNINAHTHDAVIGGDKSCDEPEKEVCPLDPTMDADDPRCEVCPYDDTMLAGDPNCKEDEPEEPVVTKTETPTSLPRTGAGAAVFSIGAIGAAAKKFIASKRGLKEALLNN